ncbi:MAG: glycosyltransferase family 4 protein [Balneola sp.]
MRIGYITKEDPNDVRAYSGTHYAMYQALKGEFEEVIPFGPVDHWYKNIAKLKGKILTFGNKKVFKFQYDIKLAQIHAKQLDEKIRKLKPDVLLGSLVSPEVAFLKTDVPLYLTTDATFPLLQDLYQSHSNLHSLSIKNALVLERMAFQKARKLMLPLEWLSKSAQNNYRIPKSKIEVIPYGSNLASPTENEVQTLINERIRSEELTFLFVGVRWEEKGGPEAVGIIKELNRKGIKAKLIVVGITPEIEEECVEVIGFLDKQDKDQLSKLIELYQNSTFFILPTKAECVGMSFIEAASYGLPAIGSIVGGVPEAVINKETGLIFDPVENPSKVADEISELWSNKFRYEEMSAQARKRYSVQMNWKNWAKRVKEILSKEVI